jgi:hypothetical protein
MLGAWGTSPQKIDVLQKTHLFSGSHHSEQNSDLQPSFVQLISAAHLTHSPKNPELCLSRSSHTGYSVAY